MPKIGETIDLTGLKASDRSQSDKVAIQKINIGGNSNTPSINNTLEGFNPLPDKSFQVTSPNSLFVDKIKTLEDNQNLAYDQALAKFQEKYNVGKGRNNSTLKQNIQNVAMQVSPYYKKFVNTSKIPDKEVDWENLAAQYEAQRDAYGEEAANIFLNNEFKNIVGRHQGIFERGIFALSGIPHGIAGAAMSLAGAVIGASQYVGEEWLGIDTDYERNKDVGNWKNFWNNVIDNEYTRWGNDIVQYGEYSRGKIEKAKQLGLPYNEIVKSKAEEDSYISWATPFEGIQQGGFTTWSIFAGAAEAKLAGWMFRGLKGASMAARGADTVEKMMKLQNVLKKWQKAEKVVNTFLLPGMAGTSEGLMEALNTKMTIQQEGLEELNKMMESEVNERIENVLKDAHFVTDQETGKITYYDKEGNIIDMNALYQKEYNALLPKYQESLRQVDYSSITGSINNLYFNSAINGLIFGTLKASITAPKVQKSLQDSKLTGWMYPKNRFVVSGVAGTESAEVSVKKLSPLGKAWFFTKEPLGEFLEEYSQTVADKTATGGAMRNITSFIDNKYNGDGTAMVGDYMSGDIGAAWSAFTGSLTSKEAIQSGIMGAVSSVIGSPVLPRQSSTGRWRDIYKRGKREDGTKESKWDVFKRMVPWRSGAISSYKEYKRGQRALTHDAQVLTDWLRDPNNKDKFDGLTGTMNWAKAMSDAALSSDEFSFRNSKLGKTINDAIMLKKLEGTEFYNSIMNTLSKVAYAESGSENAQKLIQEMRDDVNNSFDENTSDEEILKTLKSNAKLMINTLETIEKKSEEIDKLLGYTDKDTKQSLIYGDMMLDDWAKRSKQIDNEIAQIEISSERERATTLNKKQQAVLSKYGSFANAQRQLYKLQEKKQELETDISNLQKRKSLTAEDKNILEEKKYNLKNINKKLKDLEVLSTIESEGSTILNEQDIMALDPISRANMLLRGKQREYTITHSGAQEYNEMLQNLTTLQAKRRAWIKDNGKIKKGHNKQVQKIDQEIADLKAKIQSATSETRAFYSAEQQQVIDDLFNKLNAQNKELFDKIIDRGRMENSMKRFLDEYNHLILNRDAFNVYAYRVKQAAADAASINRYEALNAIQDYNTFAEEMDKMYDSSSEREQHIINQAMQESKNANFDRYTNDRALLSGLFNQMATDETFKNLDTNDQDMFAYTLQYLTNRGIDLQDNTAVVRELSKKDENGIYEFQKYVNDANSVLPELQRTVFTSVGEAINTFNQVMANYKRDIREVANNNQSIEPQPTTEAQSAPAPDVNADPNANPGVFGQAATTLEQAEQDMQKTNEPQNQPATTQEETKSVLERAIELANKIVANASDSYSADAKSRANTAIATVAKKLDSDDEVQDLIDSIIASANTVDTNANSEADEQTASLLRYVAAKLQGFEEKEEEKEGKTAAEKAAASAKRTQSIFDAMRERAQQRADMASGRNIANSAIMKTSSFDWLKNHYPNNPTVKYWEAHHVEEYLQSGSIQDRKNTPVYFISDDVLASEIKQSIESSGGVYTNDDIPLIAVVEDPQGDINIGGRRYQVIGTFPSSNQRDFNVLNSQDGTIGRQGINNIKKIRSLIDKNNPNGIIQDSRGNIITTTIASFDTTPPTHIPKGSPNVTTIELSMDELNEQEKSQLSGLSKPQMREHRIYKKMKQDFLRRLTYSQGSNFVSFMQPNVKDSGYKPVPVFHRAISDTYDSNSDRLITELFNSNDVDALLHANSRLEKAAEVLAKLARQFPNTADSNVVSLEQYGPALVASGKFAETIAAIEAQFKKEMAHHLSLPDSNWSYTIMPTDEVLSDGRRMFQLSITNGEDTTIPLGKFTNGEMDTQNQFDILKNMIMGEDGKVRMTGNWGLYKWNVDLPKGGQTIDDVKGGLAKAFDDGILEMSDGLYPSLKTIGINSPFNSQGDVRITTPPTVANNDNAIINTQGPTQVAGGAIQQGETVIDTNAGTVIQGPEPAPIKNQGQERAKEIVKQIIEDSKHLNLTGDESAYEDNVTHNRFARVTSIIAADIESEGRFEKFKLPENTYKAVIGDREYLVSHSNDVSFAYRLGENGQLESAPYNRNEVAQGLIPVLNFQQADMISSWYQEIKDYLEGNGKKNGWSDPSTAIGNSVDEFTRDFFDGKIEFVDVYDYNNEEDEAKLWGITVDQLRARGRGTHKEWKVKDGNEYKDPLEVYPNASLIQWKNFAEQLQNFKNGLTAEGITIIPRDIKASGVIEVTDREGKKHKINVAGTLDLLGYDANGNFIIFDMKTKHGSISEKDKKKWRRQLSLYQKFLQDKYGITVKETRIIPIKVNYPTPKGESVRGVDGTTEYSIEPNSNQLLANGEKFADAQPSLMPQLRNMGYREADVIYERLTDEERELINNLEQAFAEGNGVDAPQSITIETAEPEASESPVIDPILGIPVDGDGGDFWSDTPASDSPSNLDNNQVNSKGNYVNPMEPGREYTATEILNMYKAQNPNLPAGYYRLANAVFAVCNQLGVKFIKDTKLDKGAAHGRYSIDTHTVRYASSLAPNTFLHEAIHAAVKYYFYTSEEERKSLPIRIQNAISALEQCHQMMRDTFFTDKDGKPLEGLARTFRGFDAQSNSRYYGITSVDEFVAELSNPEFLKAIRKFDQKYSRSIFGKILDSIANFLGIKSDVNNVEKSAYAALKVLLENPNVNFQKKISAKAKGHRQFIKAQNSTVIQATISTEGFKKLEDAYEHRRTVHFSPEIDAVNENMRRGSIIGIFEEGSSTYSALGVITNDPIKNNGRWDAEIRLLHPDEFIGGTLKLNHQFESDGYNEEEGIGWASGGYLTRTAPATMKFTPSRLAWNSFRGFKNDAGDPVNIAPTMENLKKFYTEEQWNEMTDQEQEHELKCKGVFG